MGDAAAKRQGRDMLCGLKQGQQNLAQISSAKLACKLLNRTKQAKKAGMKDAKSTGQAKKILRKLAEQRARAARRR
jgi:hypothetical protein